MAQEENNLIVYVDSLLPSEIFKPGGSRPIIDWIKKQVESFVPDLSTAKSRAEISSMAYKVSQSKTFIEKKGIDLKAEYKAKIDPIDAERKALRDELDALRDWVRKPLTDWEAEQERIKQEAEALEKFNKDWDQAIIDNDFINREREVARKEAELRRIEEERKAKEEAEQAEARRIASEERIKKEAAEQARKDAEAKAQAEKEAAIRKQMEAEQAAKKAQEEKEAAEIRAKIAAEQAEARRIAEAKEAQERHEREKRDALEAQAKAQAEKERLAKVEADRLQAIDDARKADVEHRGKINRSILKKFVSLGASEELAKALICAMAKGEIKNVSINY